MPRRARGQAPKWNRGAAFPNAEPQLEPVAGLLPAAAADGERAKQSFLAAISHELRTPLNAVIGFAEIIDAELLGPVAVPQYREYVRDILTSSRHLLQVIEDVLDISRAESGELVLARREVDLRGLVEDVAAVHRPISSRREITLSLQVPDGIVVQVDPPKLGRAVACLLSNAIKFSPDGSDIRISASVDNRSRVTLAIEDHGVGMAPAEIDRAFAPFAQLDDELSRKFEGAGVGVPLASAIAQLHGGKLQLQSTPGVGTTAILEFPAYPGTRPGGWRSRTAGSGHLLE